MQKVLFRDRDGTIINEPPTDFQIDSLEKLEFIPKVITNLNKIATTLDFELAMVTNQDGLGTSSFPEETFWPAHNKMLQTLKGEGIIFADIHIDKSFPEDNSPARKPGTAMLKKYFDKDTYDLANSFVIGDRITDVQLAKNLGCKAILFTTDETIIQEIKIQSLTDTCALTSNNWDEICVFLFNKERTATVVRQTSETQITIQLNLDGTGKCNISTGLSFFDHMLEQIGKHSGCDLTIQVKGDLHVDEHHTIEDTALALGQAFKEALGDKRGIERYGYCLPMDDCQALVSLDFGGRPWLVWEADFQREKIGDMPTEMFLHFFKSFSDTSLSNLHIQAKGDNEHHKIEGIFKALARSIKMAVKKDVFNDNLPSTKVTL